MTAKDELEFDLWVTGIRALSYHWKRYDISKMILLGHSRLFNDRLKEKKIHDASKPIVNMDSSAYSSKKLMDCLARQPLTTQELEVKVAHLSKRLRSLRHKVEEVDEDAEHNPIGTEGVGMGYVMAAQTEERAEDKGIQID